MSATVINLKDREKPAFYTPSNTVVYTCAVCTSHVMDVFHVNLRKLVPPKLFSSTCSRRDASGINGKQFYAGKISASALNRVKHFLLRTEDAQYQMSDKFEPENWKTETTIRLSQYKSSCVSPVKKWRIFVGAKFYCPYPIAEGN